MVQAVPQKVKTEFSKRLRYLRKKAGLTQRELAANVSVSETYINKIENRKFPPPSEKVLNGIARELSDALSRNETDLSDELILLAGKIPSDVARIIKRNPYSVKFLRSIGKEVIPDTKWQELTDLIQRGG